MGSLRCSATSSSPLDSLWFPNPILSISSPAGLGDEKVVMVNDVSRAFFEAPAVRQVCVAIPYVDLTATDRKWTTPGICE